MSERYLRVGILHLDVVARRLDLNLANFLALAEEAADKGAQLVVGTEMSLSGYCFEDRDSLLPYAQSEDGEALGQISKWAAKRGVYVAIGLAELAKPEGIIYNSAFFIDDKGKILGRARKINAESRWACPGPPVQDNIWPTPWGQVGMRICSDSWHSLIIRISALKGADLLLLPANCPPMGLDPCDLWRFRAKENGLWFIACNRTGQEKDLDCLEATSCAFDPYGQELFRGQSPQSAAFMVDLPLNEKGQLDNQRKKEILAQRTPQNHYRLCGNFNYIKDLTRYLKLPEPGELELTAFIPRAQENPADFLENTPQPWPNGLIFLPNWPYSPNDLERLNNLAGDRAILTQVAGEWAFLGSLKGERVSRAKGLYLIDHGPARIWLAQASEIVQPEAAIAAAKTGADLAVAYMEAMNPETRLLASVRTIDQLATCLVAPDGAAMGLLWVGHEAAEEAKVEPGQRGGLTLDTNETRSKSFQDRLDFSVLFQNENL